MKTLILTVGLPKSGKTWWASRQNQPVVNPDAIRLALHGQVFEPRAEPTVWSIARVMVRHYFEYRPGPCTVILDATNITPQRREEWLSREWQVKYAVFDTSLEVCRRRAVETGFPEDVLNRMSRQMVLPAREDDRVVHWMTLR